MELHLKPTTNSKYFYENHSFAYSGDSGLDLFCVHDLLVKGGETLLVDLEIAVELRAINKRIALGGPNQLFTNKSMFLMPRSSIYKTPLRFANSVGLIDSSYRGNLKLALDNISDEDYTIKKGDRLAQLVAPNLEHFELVVTYQLSESKRNENGFGSSGK